MSARLSLKVTPKASRNCLQGWLGEDLKVAVTTAPEKGKANRAVIKLLAAELDVPASAIHLISGETQPRKVLEITGLSTAELHERITTVLE